MHQVPTLLVTGLLVLCTLIEQGSSQAATCYNARFYLCNRNSAVETVDVDSGTQCCDDGFLTFTVAGVDGCQTCSDNAICYRADELNLCQTASFPPFFIGSIHDCCLIQDGQYYQNLDSEQCLSCSNAMFQCHEQESCGGTANTELSGSPDQSRIENCCLGPGSSYMFRGQCFSCTVVGWVNSSFEAAEAGPAYTLQVGYLSGDSDGVIPADIEVVGGTAGADDFLLQTNSVLIRAGVLSTVVIQFQVDGVALEDVETVTLRLVPRADSLPSGVFVTDEIVLSILDSDELTVDLTEADYSGNERDSSIDMALSKSLRIANPLTVQVQPLTVAAAESEGRLPPNVPPDDNPNSPNRAGSGVGPDFNSAPINITFEPDENGSQVFTVDFSVGIIDDEVNEAFEEFFVAVFDPPPDVVSTRSSTLARIVDNDDIRIGFQQASYTFVESEGEQFINSVALEKENGRVTEQTFEVLITYSNSTAEGVPATEGEDYDTPPAPVVLLFTPQIQILTPAPLLILLGDNQPELLEGLTVTSAPTGSPLYSAPISLFASTNIVIRDDDPIVISFVSDYVVEENMGSVNACVRAANVPDSDPLPFTIPILALVTGMLPGDTTDASDFVGLPLSVELELSDQRRRDCFTVQINDDELLEGSETATLNLTLDTSRPFTERFAPYEFVPGRLTILPNDNLCRDLEPPSNGAVSYSPDNGGPLRDIGTEATFTCNDGFALMGPSIRTCQSGAIWSGSSPTCEPLCPDLGDLPRGVISYSPDTGGPFRAVGTVATHTCDTGFAVDGTATRECLAGGMWSGSDITCDDIDECALETDPCEQLCENTIGSFLCDCREGFILQPDGISCAALCPDLGELARGVIGYSPDTGGPFRNVGTLATHFCAPGFTLEGTMTRECLAGGTWSGSAPTCELACPDLGVLLRGIISYSPDTGGPFRAVGTVATYTCDEELGFFLVGTDRTRECLAGGTWSGSPPFCEQIPTFCPSLAPLLNGVIVYDPNFFPHSVGTSASYVCNDGFSLVGDGVRVCQENGSFSGSEPTCRPLGTVNDTVTGDPVMTVPLYLTDTTALSNVVGEGELVSLCFEVHGANDTYFNLVSDSCVAVNAHYIQPHPELEYNIINAIALRAVSLSGACRNISVWVDCVTLVDGTIMDSPMYSSDGISVRRYRNRVRIVVPNCDNIDLVMWVFCESGTFEGDPDYGEPDISITVPMIRFVIARGLNLRESAHGILGQFWNVPIGVEKYTGPLYDDSVRDDTYIITVEYPEQTPRQFLSFFENPIWEAEKGGYCLYAGNSQGGSIAELVSPNDPVMEGVYSDYIVSDKFETDFEYSHFNQSECRAG